MGRPPAGTGWPPASRAAAGSPTPPPTPPERSPRAGPGGGAAGRYRRSGGRRRYARCTLTGAAVPAAGALRTTGAGMPQAAQRLLLLADTHVPKRARDLPAEVWAAVDDADVVLHAGDWVAVSLLDALEQRARRLVAVYGNNDGPALRARLPEVARAELGGLRFAVVHETGGKAGREARCE